MFGVSAKMPGKYLNHEGRVCRMGNVDTTAVGAPPEQWAGRTSHTPNSSGKRTDWWRDPVTKTIVPDLLLSRVHVGTCTAVSFLSLDENLNKNAVPVVSTTTHTNPHT